MLLAVLFTLTFHFEITNTGKRSLSALFPELTHHSNIQFATQQHPEGWLTLWRSLTIKNKTKHRGFREEVLPVPKQMFGAKKL